MTSTVPAPHILSFSSTRKLKDEGFSLPVLLAIEHDAMLQARELAQMRGTPAMTKPEVEALAQSLLPAGDRMYQLYTECKARMASRPLQEVEYLAASIQNAAIHLESLAAKIAAAGHKTTLAFAQAQGAIGARLADLMQACDSLKELGILTTDHRRGRLQTLVDMMSSGPLREYQSKALAIVENRAVAPAVRLRAVA